MAIIQGANSTTVPATSLDLVSRAFSLPDLTGSLHITHDDIYRSANECWKGVYTNLVSSDQDFYIKEVVCAWSTTWQQTTTGPWEYFISFAQYAPDHMKTRWVEWNNNPNWIPMNKYNLDNKGMQAPYPMYHERNNGIQIISGMLSSSVSSVRIGYVPQSSVITIPDNNIYFGLSYSAANFNLISQQTYVYFSGAQTYDAMIYVYNNTQLTIEINQNAVSGGTSAPIALYTASYTIAGTYYYKGYVYWVSSTGNLYYAALDVTNPGTVTPTQVTSASGCNFIHIFNNVIWVGTNLGIYTAPFLGNTFTEWASGINATCVQTLGGNVYYCDSAGNLWFNNTTTYGTPQELLTAAQLGVLDLANDGINLYVLDSSNNLWLYTPSVIAGVCTLGSGTLLMSDVAIQIAEWQNNRLPILTQEGRQLFAFSTFPNMTLAFPSNIIYDMLCYQMAADFCRKQKDQDRMTLMEARLDDLKNTYMSAQYRDTYRPPRTRHVNVTKPYGLI
jgi:hypothetical protein